MALNPLRKKSEKLLQELNKELDIEQKGIEQLSDKELLKYINTRLINLNCVQLTDEELYMQLTKIEPSERVKGVYSNKQWWE